ncbi:MAG: hypothetical protein A2W00_04435 [Candidatus Eisenbacteria bacterium RBG_16_71_46]|nr:MAG: hypothetical protein A2V59_06845 [Armatimonadetes bacterium RBG_19FT_COMBO_69_19]OGF05199.1 MAG: hypothetical protein A2W00_04435 [Candidatus Eisenbacteria bacterium RBG_16_71_46]
MSTYQPKVYREQGGSRQVVASGGSLDVESGGEIDIESGGALKINGTAITVTAAEINAMAGTGLDATELGYLNGSGTTVVASKAVIADANKDVVGARQATLGVNGAAGVAGQLNVRDGQNPGSVASVVYADVAKLAALTATADEINKLDGAPLDATIVVGAETGGNTINVAVQLKDGNAADLAVRGHVRAYLSDDANGDSLAAATPSGGIAIGTDGLLVSLTPALANALIVDGNLAIDAVPEKFKTTQTAAFMLNGVSHTKAATTALTFTAAHVITASKFGVILIQINAAGTVSTKVPASPQAYNDAPTALAALPAADAGNIALGYIAIENNAGDWTANTDDLTNGSDVTTAAFNDSTETALSAVPKAFDLVSESDGDIDINLIEAGAATWYLILVLPNGKLVASGAITFV